MPPELPNSEDDTTSSDFYGDTRPLVGFGFPASYRIRALKVDNISCDQSVSAGGSRRP